MAWNHEGQSPCSIGGKFKGLVYVNNLTEKYLKIHKNIFNIITCIKC